MIGVTRNRIFMAIVQTTFITTQDTIRPSEFRSITPKRCKLSTVNLSAELQERYGVEQLLVVINVVCTIAIKILFLVYQT